MRCASRARSVKASGNTTNASLRARGIAANALVHLRLVADRKILEAQTERLRRGLRDAQLPLLARMLGTGEDRDPRELRQHVLEQLDPLADKLQGEKRHAGEGVPRPSQALAKPASTGSPL